MLKSLIAEGLPLLELTIKQVVRTDMVAQKRLALLQGRVITIEMTSPVLTFSVLPVSDGLEFSFASHEADCTLRGSWVDFLEVAEDQHRLFSNKVTVEGDHALLAELKSILTELDIDWEALIAKITGDLPAHELSKFFRSTQRYARDTSTLLLSDFNDYIHEELRLVPSKVELELFYQDVNELRLKVDRLQARLDQLDTHNADEIS